MPTPKQIKVVSVPTANVTEELAVYRDESGGIFGIDASYVEQEVGRCFNPFTGEEFEPE